LRLGECSAGSQLSDARQIDWGDGLWGVIRHVLEVSCKEDFFRRAKYLVPCSRTIPPGGEGQETPPSAPLPSEPVRDWWRNSVSDRTSREMRSSFRLAVDWDRPAVQARAGRSKRSNSRQKPPIRCSAQQASSIIAQSQAAQDRRFAPGFAEELKPSRESAGSMVGTESPFSDGPTAHQKVGG
jgi:hypothetical protein